MSMPAKSMAENTMASVKGMERAMIRPGAHPETDEADGQYDGDGLPQRRHELRSWRFRRHRPIRDELRLDTDGKIRRRRCHRAFDVLVQGEKSPPSRIAIARPIAGTPLTRNMGCEADRRSRAGPARCR